MRFPRADSPSFPFGRFWSAHLPRKVFPMRSYKLTDLWFKTVKDTELERYNWDEIAQVLSEYGLITLVAAPNENVFSRYKLNHDKLNCEKSENLKVILEVLRRELPRRFGRV
jgi:hypothetical protein